MLQILGTDELSAIPDEQIASLRIFVESTAAVTPCAYVAGVPVRVERGPYAGVTGIVISTRGKAHLNINVDAFGRACKVECDIADIKAADIKAADIKALPKAA